MAPAYQAGECGSVQRLFVGAVESKSPLSRRGRVREGEVNFFLSQTPLQGRSEANQMK